MSEVASFPQPLSQFFPGKSPDMCVAFGVADINFSGRPGGPPSGTPAQAADLAQHWYAQLEGSNDASNTNGMDLEAEYTMLRGLGLRFIGLSGDLIAQTRAYLEHGIPVLICGAESSFYDIGLGRVPYSWDPVYNHCIVASGLGANGNFLVRDYANEIASPGTPRTYDTSKMRLISATAVYPHWSTGMVPHGWKYDPDKQELTGPNGVKVRKGFEEFILSHAWDSSDWPLIEEAGRPVLEDSNPALGGGTFQIFRKTMLEWTDDRGVFVSWIGQELLKVRQELSDTRAALKQAQGPQDLTQARKDIAAAQTDLDAAAKDLTPS